MDGKPVNFGFIFSEIVDWTKWELQSNRINLLLSPAFLSKW